METTKETTYYKGMEEIHMGRISWPAIFAGTIIMLIILLLLSLLGIGVGSGAINPAEEAKPLAGIGTGALVWWVISNLVAIFAGAFVAANLTNAPYKMTGIYHGILSWSLYALISFFLMTTAVGGVINGVGGMVAKSLSAVGTGISQLSNLPDQADNNRFKEMLQDVLTRDQASSKNKKQFDIDIMAVVQDVFIQNGKINPNINRTDIENSVAKHSTLSKADVSRITDMIMQQYGKIEQQMPAIQEKTEERTQKITDATSKAAIWSFVALLLGGITASVGGMLGEPDVVAISEKRTGRGRPRKST